MLRCWLWRVLGRACRGFVRGRYGARCVPGANGLIAFQVNATTSDGSFIEHIYVVEPDGTGLRDLSTVSAPDGLVLDANPAWSPDGTKIAFDSNRAAARVFVMNANGTGVHQITGQPGSDPAWSPDGNRLAFGGTATSSSATGRRASSASSPTRCSRPPPSRRPVASPSRPAGVRQLRRLVRHAEHLHRAAERPAHVPATFDGRSAEPDFSPDGSRIVFSSTRDGASSDGSDLYLMRADGTRPRRLTAVGAFHEGVGEPAVVAGPDAGPAFELGGPFASDLMNLIAIAPAGTPPLDSVSVMLSVGGLHIFPSGSRCTDRQ